jgi:hypothetical protein
MIWSQPLAVRDVSMHAYEVRPRKEASSLLTVGCDLYDVRPNQQLHRTLPASEPNTFGVCNVIETTNQQAISKSREFCSHYVTIAAKWNSLWISLSRLWKKPSPFADKSIVCKNVFPPSWEAPLRDPQALRRQGATFRPRLEPSFLLPPKLAG